MACHEEPSSARVSTAANLKEPLPITGFRLRSPFADSLVRILSLNDDGGGLHSDSSPTCGFNWKWAPINFGTSSARCPRALNLLSGRFFSATSGLPLDPPACPADIPGCICRRGPFSLNEGRNLLLGGSTSDFSRISETSCSEIGSLVPSSPKHAMQGGAIETVSVLSGSMDTKVADKRLDFEGRMDKSHTEDADRNQSTPTKVFEDVGNVANRDGDEDIGIPCSVPLFDGTQRKQEELEDGKLVSSDANPFSSITEELDTTIVDELFTDSTIPTQIRDIEEGEIPDDELQIPMTDSFDSLPNKTYGFSEASSCSKTSSRQGPVNVPILKDVSYPHVCGTVALASTDCSAHANLRDKDSDICEGNAGRWALLKIKPDKPTGKSGARCELENQGGNGNGSGIGKAELNVPLPQEKFSAENLASKMTSDGKEVQVHKNNKKRGPVTEEGKAKRKEKKKRKRAEMNRKLGVKRLKLPVSLPKVKPVSLCRFYLYGQCRQGKECKFSHDAVPLTKSQPCRYYASQSHPCLKGDACPYDHDLSKYPCHNFVSKGFCIRGDKCMFSHKVPPNGDASANTKVTSVELEKHFAKSNIRKPTNGMTSKKVACLGLIAQPSEKPLMLPSKVPEGISFLSCGKAALGAANDQQVDKQPVSNAENTTPSRKQNLNTEQGSFETPSVSQGSACSSLPSFKSTQQECKNAPSSVRRAISNALAFASKYQPQLVKTSVAASVSCLQSDSTPQSGSLIVGSRSTTSVGGSNERSKSATAILEEFLFGGANT